MIPPDARARSKTTIKVMLVDDHAVVRMGLANFLSTAKDIEVVAECGTGETAIDLYTRKRPDVLMLDWQLPGISGVEAAEKIRAQHPGARIIIFSVFEGEQDIQRAVDAGASGYLTKAVIDKEIVRAVRAVAEGGTYFSPLIAARLEESRRRPQLNEREREVLELLVEGFSNKEIAARVRLAEITVKVYVSRVFEKLGVQDRTQALKLALQRGWVRLS